MKNKIWLFVISIICAAGSASADERDVIYHKEFSEVQDEKMVSQVMSIAYKAFIKSVKQKGLRYRIMTEEGGTIMDDPNFELRDIHSFVREEVDKWVMCFGVENADFSYYGLEKCVIFTSYSEVHINKQSLEVIKIQRNVKVFRWMKKPFSKEKWLATLNAAAPYALLINHCLDFFGEGTGMVIYEMTLHPDIIIVSFFHSSYAGDLPSPDKKGLLSPGTGDVPNFVYLDKQTLEFIGYSPGDYEHVEGTRKFPRKGNLSSACPRKKY